MFKADLHVHSSYSRDGQHSISMLAAEAARKDLAVIALCDHDTIAKKQKVPGSLILYGEEVSCAEGHVCVLGIEEPFPSGLPASQVVKDAHREGGVAIVSHPYAFGKASLREKAFEVGADAVERFNGASALNNLITLDRNINGTGGSDAHTLYELGNAYTVFECEPREDDMLAAIRAGEYYACWNTDLLSIARRHANKLDNLFGELGWK